MAVFHIRFGRPEDMEAVHALVQELAAFEKAPEQVKTNAERLRADGFGERPLFETLVAEHPQAGIIGMALFYFGYSTWKGKMLYLDDLVVAESHRKQGIGRALFQRLIEYGVSQQAQLIKWQVLDWNQDAIRFYREQLGAAFDGEWLDCKLFPGQMQKLLDARANDFSER